MVFTSGPDIAPNDRNELPIIGRNFGPVLGWNLFWGRDPGVYRACTVDYCLKGTQVSDAECQIPVIYVGMVFSFNFSTTPSPDYMWKFFLSNSSYMREYMCEMCQVWYTVMNGSWMKYTHKESQRLAKHLLIYVLRDWCDKLMCCCLPQSGHLAIVNGHHNCWRQSTGYGRLMANGDYLFAINH